MLAPSYLFNKQGIHGDERCLLVSLKFCLLGHYKIAYSLKLLPWFEIFLIELARNVSLMVWYLTHCVRAHYWLYIQRSQLFLFFFVFSFELAVGDEEQRHLYSTFFFFLLFKGIAMLPFGSADFFLPSDLVNTEAPLLPLYWMSFTAEAWTTEMPTKCCIWCLPLCHMTVSEGFFWVFLRGLSKTFF